MIRLWILTVILLCTLSVFKVEGQSKLEMSSTLISAYKDITSLKIEDGRKKIKTSQAFDSDNAMAFYIENYIDFFTLFIQEDYYQYKKRLPSRDFRLSKIKDSDKSSPYYLYCQAEIILQWAIIKLKFDDKFSAAKDVYSAYKLLVRNESLFPEFTENYKSLSIIHALAESLPGWVRKIVGVKGSVASANKEIEVLLNKVTKENHFYKNEVVAIYSYMQYYVNNNKEDAFLLYDKYKLDSTTNPLITFLKATMAHNVGRNDYAISILEQRPKSGEYLPFYYLDFLMGKFKLNRLDNDADVYLKRFTNNFKGRHYIKEAYQKLAWFEWVVKSNPTGYRTYMKKCQSHGSKLLDEDKQADKEAQEEGLPDKVLLSVRMLFDGGYYNRALVSLLDVETHYINSSTHDGEFYYRMGRVNEALKNEGDALKYYDITINKSNPTKYYACSAALRSGLIYESKKNYKMAIEYFNNCLALNPEGYSSSLHQKAKSGLSRVN